MSQATIMRKERRKRFIAKLKQGYNDRHSGFVTDQPSFPGIFREVIAATQHSFHAVFVEGCNFGKNVAGKPTPVHTSHVASQTEEPYEVAKHDMHGLQSLSQVLDESSSRAVSSSRPKPSVDSKGKTTLSPQCRTPISTPPAAVGLPVGTNQSAFAAHTFLCV